ncbi:MAG: protein kinase [Parachlamydiales bacterium]|jgi:serine/threonine protein kinase
MTVFRLAEAPIRKLELVFKNDGACFDLKCVVQEVLGQGAYGQVYRLAYHRDQKLPAVIPEQLAAKIFWDMNNFFEFLSKGPRFFLKELDPLRFSYPLEGFLNEGYLSEGKKCSRVFLVVIPFFSGKNLFDYTIKEKEGAITDFSEQKEMLVGFCELVREMHQKKIFHLDIKPENLIFGKDRHVRLVDFDFSCVEETRRRKLYDGTYNYMAPEILFNNILKIAFSLSWGSVDSCKIAKIKDFAVLPNEKTDVWSMLVTLFNIFNGIELLSFEKVKIILEGEAEKLLDLCRRDLDKIDDNCHEFYQLFLERMQNDVKDSIEQTTKEGKMGFLKDFFLKMIMADPALRLAADDILREVEVAFPEAAVG